MRERTFPNDELSGVGSVQTIDAVGPGNPILDPRLPVDSIAIAEELCSPQDVLSSRFEGPNDVLISTVGISSSLAELACRDDLVPL